MQDTEKLLRPRTAAGKAVTNVRSKTNWEDWTAEAAIAPAPLDAPGTSSQNTTTPSSESSLSSLEDDEGDNNIPFPELEVPELDFETPWLKFKSRPRHLKKEPLSSVAAAPDYDLDKFFTLAFATQPKVIMPTARIREPSGFPEIIQPCNASASCSTAQR
jgi:hypothetical protein